MKRITIILVGLGPIGLAVLRSLKGDSLFRISAAVDSNPEWQGKSLDSLAGDPEWQGLTIRSAPEEPRAGETAVAVLCTGSRLEKTFPLIREYLIRGCHVISTCEELIFPVPETDLLWKEIDTLARKKARSVLGIGINPGFLMDLLPTVMSAPCLTIQRVTVERQLDASTRRARFQDKIGAGLTLQEFRRRRANGTLTGHIGLKQSFYFFTAALGWNVEKISESPPEAVLDPEGSRVLGQKQALQGLAGGREIEYRFAAFRHAPEEHDRITITGEPTFTMTLSPCIHGDTGTIGMVKNAIPNLIRSTPGLKTGLDLLPLHFR